MIDSRYLSKGRLMRLNPHEKAGELAVDNDNGILFLTEYLMLKKFPGKALFWLSVERLTVEPGLYLRAEGRIHDKNSFDNDLAISCGSALHDTKHAEDIVIYGVKHGWVYTTRTKKWWWRDFRVPSIIFTLKINAGWIPSLVDCAWYAGAMVLTMFYDTEAKSSEHILTWLTFEALFISLQKHQNIPILHRRIITIAYAAWRIKVKEPMKLFATYFRQEDHPIRLAAGV